MIRLTKANVWKYKSIENSTPVDIDPAVTVLVGKNESGKTAFLEALYKSTPLESGKFRVVSDYPRKDYVRYQRQHEAGNYAKVTDLSYELTQRSVDKINREVFGGEKVIKPGLTFTRSTNYNNGHTVGLSGGGAAALEALKKALKDVENVDKVFEGADDLESVIAKIDELELPADATLAKFAAEWEGRFKDAANGWDMIGWHIWHKYIQPELPHFLYFDDYKLLPGKVNLDTLVKRQASGDLSGSDETVLGLLDLAGIELDDLTSDEGYETAKAKLEAIGLSITHQVFEYWRQNQDLAVEFDIKADTKDEAPFNTGKNLYIRIKNNRHGVTVPFDQRSKGFIWFFSFMAWFSAIETRADTEKTLVLLLDEPGLNLHALAQKDFLSYIERLAEDHQIIYSTHSPFMVQSDKLDRVRVVEDHQKVGTTVSSDIQGSSDESVFPLQAALGYTVAQNLFIAKDNILVEGPADLILLQHMSSLLEQSGKVGLKTGVFVPTGGLDKIVTFVALIGAQDLNLVVLHDRGPARPQKIDDLINEKLIARRKVMDYAFVTDKAEQETDLEDLFPEALYIDAFNEAYKKELGDKPLTADTLGKHPRIIARINKWLEDSKIVLLKDGGFNHYRVAQALIPHLTLRKVGKETLEKFGKLFDRINFELSEDAVKREAA